METNETRKPGRPTGHPKTGGRQKGTPNKVTADIKDWITGLVWRNKQQMEADLRALEPKDRLALMEKLLAYVIPKQRDVQTTIDLSQLPEENLDMIINELIKEIES